MGDGAQQFRKKFKQLTSEIEDPEHELISECTFVVASALEVGPDINSLVNHTGYSRQFIEAISIRMHEAGLWIGQSVDDREWWDERIKPGFALFIHACVAKGGVRRIPRDDGSYAYINSETGNLDWEWKASVAAGV